MLKIGLTGGIGSGKTTVAKLFEELGVPIIDADIIARESINKSSIFKKILNHFGDKVLDHEKNLDRKALGKLIFSNFEEKRWLEMLLHPMIVEEMQKQVENLTAPYCILVIPLLIEAVCPYTLVDRILVVDACEKTQIMRTKQRDKVSQADVKAILSSQATKSQRLEVADDVIQNEADLLALRERVKNLHEDYLRLSESQSSS